MYADGLGARDIKQTFTDRQTDKQANRQTDKTDRRKDEQIDTDKKVVTLTERSSNMKSIGKKRSS